VIIVLIYWILNSKRDGSVTVGGSRSRRAHTALGLWVGSDCYLRSGVPAVGYQAAPLGLGKHCNGFLDEARMNNGCERQPLF
jgi:hypothetical protein